MQTANKNVFNTVAEVITEKDRGGIKIKSTSPKSRWKLVNIINGLLHRTKTKEWVIMPLLAGNMYRISGKGCLLPPKDNTDQSPVSTSCGHIASHMDIVCYSVAAVLENSHLEPSGSTLSSVENDMDCDDLLRVLDPVLQGSELTEINDYYGIFNDKTTTDTKMYTKDTQAKLNQQKRLKSSPHHTLGNAMIYFKGSMSEWDIKWRLTWHNLLCYLSATPLSSDMTNSTNPPLEVKDAADVF